MYNYNHEAWEEIKIITDKLNDILLFVQPDLDSPCPGYEKKKKGAAAKDHIDCHEVYPNIILGDGVTAKKKSYLKKIGVTHVLNAAMGSSYFMVNTDAGFYRKENIQFLGISLSDLPTSQISLNFDQVSNFIENALNANGKVYVHCVCGISRSSTCVIAFLMMKRFMSAEDALRRLRSKRFIGPNNGFLKQLAMLEIELRAQHTDYPRSDHAPTQIPFIMMKKCNIL